MQARCGRRARAAAALLLTVAVAAGCTGDDDEGAPVTTAGQTTPTTAPEARPDQRGDAEPTPLGFAGIALSEGQAPSTAAPAAAVVAGTPLDDAGVAAVLARLDPFTGAAAATAPFAWPAETITRPVGERTDVPFPATEQVDPPAAVPATLEVLRAQPAGAVGLAPFLTVTFNQPMVPVGTIAQLAAADVPATIQPAVDGRWQWIGTSTLRFDAAARDRLPMATDYTVTVPAGTRAASGAELATPYELSFSTPPAEVAGFSADRREDLPLQPVFVATFDQDVDAGAVLGHVELTADGERRDVRLATADEVTADESAQAADTVAAEGRAVAFTTTEPLVPNQAIDVTFTAGVPSTEGPVLSTTARSYSMRTYAPLQITGVRCWQTPCRPGDTVEITFNNELDAGLFDPDGLTIEPAVTGRTFSQFGNTVTVQGAWLANSTYQVTVPATLADVHGQTLGAPDTREVAIGPARPMVRAFDDLVVTVDPSAAPAVPVVTVGHEQLHVTVWAADPAQWSDTVATLTRMIGGEDIGEPPWPVLRDETIDVVGDPDAPAETSISLADVMPDGHGQVIVRVASVREFPQNSEDFWLNRPALAWVQGTDLGVDAVSDNEGQHVWVTDLSTGTPIEGVTVGDIAGGQTATTGADGLAVLALPTGPPDGMGAVTASRDGDVALLPSYRMATPVPTPVLWHLVDDRGTYRPGETYRAKGWVRSLSADRQLQAWDGDGVDYVAHDGTGIEIARGRAEVQPTGSFHLEFAIPAGANTGTGWVSLDEGSSGGGQHPLLIAEYRRPDFEVTTSAGPGPYRRADPITVTANADYYTAGPIADATVTWQVTTSEATYRPPGWDRFDFGRWTPWWIAGDVFREEPFGRIPCCGPVPSKVETFTGRTDAAGTHALDLRVGALDPDVDGLPVTVRANAAVQDLDRQTIAGTTDLLIHPADLYVGLGGTATFVRQGQPLPIDVIVTDIDGAAVAGRDIEVVAGRTTGRFVDGAWTEELLDTTTCTVTSGPEPVPCTITPPAGGTYRITAHVTDDAGRVSMSETTRWVSGAEAIPRRTVEREDLVLVPDAEEHAPGSTAEVLVQAPFDAGTGLVVTDRGPIRSTATFAVVDGSAIVPIEVGAADVPNINVSIEVAGSAPRRNPDGTPVDGAPDRPAFATGSITLPVSTASRTLDVTATPADAQLAPGEATTLDVEVKGPDGAPAAGSDLLVVVVDEAVLALSGYELADPAASFYAHLPTDVATTYGRDGIVLVDPTQLLGTPGGGDDLGAATTAAGATEATVPAAAPVAPDASRAELDTAAGGAAAPPGVASPPIAVRSNFDAVALFAPDVTTDADGHATVDVTLPDNLTRYRVMVVAAAGAQQFGTAEANLSAALPLMVRPQPPRFLNFGDRFELPVVVQNDTAAPIDADVVVESANLGTDAPAGVRVTVPATDRVEVRFAMAAEDVGRAALRVTAVSGERADSATVSLPVYTPSTSETFATYGVLDDGAVAQPVLAPADVIPQFGGLEVSTSSTGLQALTDAVLYLTEYPYASADGLASQLIAISSLRDVLDAFDAPTAAAGRGHRRRRRRLHHRADGAAERRRRLAVVGTRPPDRGVQHDPGHPQPDRRQGSRLRRAPGCDRPGRRRARPDRAVLPARARPPGPLDAAGLRPPRPGAAGRRRSGRRPGALRRGRRRPAPRRPRLAVAGDRRPGDRHGDRPAARQRRRRHRRCGDVHDRDQ